MAEGRLLARPLRFDEAEAFLRDKVAMAPEDFARLQEAARSKAFTAAGIASLHALEDLLALLQRAMEEGWTLREFQQEAPAVLERHGYTGLTPYQTDNIFRTNMQVAFQAGRYRQMTRPDVLRARPYWQYDAVNDRRTRPTHRALDGKVFRADDPFWDTWYPPNGFRCRCSVRSLSEEEVRRQGLVVESGVPDMVEVDGMARPLLPDPGWGHNPAKAAWEPDLQRVDPELRAAFERRQARQREG